MLIRGEAFGVGDLDESGIARVVDGARVRGRLHQTGRTRLVTMDTPCLRPLLPPARSHLRARSRRPPALSTITFAFARFGRQQWTPGQNRNPSVPYGRGRDPQGCALVGPRGRKAASKRKRGAGAAWARLLVVVGQVLVEAADHVDGPALDLVVAAVGRRVGAAHGPGEADELGPGIEVAEIVLRR